MAVTILSESYGPRKPFVVCTAASTDELADYAGLWAEGSEATISTTKYVLDKTNGWVLPGQSGKELPAVTAEDDGDVLTVVSGAWGKAAPSGGGDTVIVNATESEDYLTRTLDKTWKEINDGKYSIIRFTSTMMGNLLVYYQICQVILDDMDPPASYNVIVKDLVNNTTLTFKTATQNGYPAWTSGG